MELNERTFSDRELRDSLTDHYDLLEKVKQPSLLPVAEVATLKQVAEYYGVDEKYLQKLYTKYKDELISDGANVVSYKDLGCGDLPITKEKGKVIITFANGETLSVPNRGLTVFSQRAILRVGMLLPLTNETGKLIKEALMEFIPETEKSEEVVDAATDGEVLKVVEETQILGRDIKLYGSVDRPLFLAKDVAEWIDYSKLKNGFYQITQMLAKVDENEKALKIFNSPGGLQNAWFLTEDGLYECCMRSTKSQAKELKKQIKDYLRNIRKTGAAFEIGREAEAIAKYFPSFSEDVKLAMVQDLRTQNEKLRKDNEALAGETVEWKDRNKISSGIRKLAGVAGIQYGTLWNQLYTNLQYKFGIDLHKRGTRKPPFIQYVKEDEWDKVLKTFSALCATYKQSPSDMFQDTKLKAQPS